MANMNDVASAVGDALESQQQRIKVMEKQVCDFVAMGSRPNTGGGGQKTLADAVYESKEFIDFARTGHGQCSILVPDFQQKTAILASTVGYSAPGVVGSQHLAGIIPAAMETFRVRDLLRQIPTTAGMVDWIKVNSYTKASPVAEDTQKKEGAITFEAVSEKMKTLAHFVPASRGVLQDVAGLQEAINIHLMGGLRDIEDEQLLAGDGTNENLNGLMTLADDWDVTILPPGDGFEYIDVISGAIQQVAQNKYRATGVVLNPADWGKISRTKDSTGRYILGDPAQMTQTRMWGLPVAVTPAMVEGYFLVGAFATGAALYVRMDGIVEASDSNREWFELNKICLRCEERLLLATYTPAGFVQGSLTQSPL
jgi:HK97 family phage major capsid protein